MRDDPIAFLGRFHESNYSGCVEAEETDRISMGFAVVWECR